MPGAVCLELIQQSIAGISTWCGTSQQVRVKRLRPARAIFFESFSGEIRQFVLRSGKQIGPALFRREFLQKPPRKSILLFVWKLLSLCKRFLE